MGQEKAVDSLIGAGIKEIIKTPVLAVSFVILWLSGTILCFLYIQTNPKFAKHTKLADRHVFKLAVGLLPGAILMLLHHCIFYQKVLCNLEDFSKSALPSSLILAGITCILLFWRALRK